MHRVAVFLRPASVQRPVWLRSGPAAVERVRHKEACLRSPVFEVTIQDPCFGICLQHPVEDANHRLPSLSVDEWITEQEFFAAKNEALQSHELRLNTKGTDVREKY